MPDTLTVMQVVEAFKRHRQTVALVINEYGSPQGLVTINDVMQALVGDIATVGDERDIDVVRRDDGSWLIDGGITVERFKTCWRSKRRYLKKASAAITRWEVL